MVRSVMDMSLSIEPTSPTSLRCECWVSWEEVMSSVGKVSKGYESIERTRTLSVKTLDDLWPFRSEDVGTCEGPITTADHERIYTLLDKIESSSGPAFQSPKRGTPSCADKGATLSEEFQSTG